VTDVTKRGDKLAAMRAEILVLLAKINAAFEASERMPVEARQAARSSDPEAIK
jgi:hypothetical protein